MAAHLKYCFKITVIMLHVRSYAEHMTLAVLLVLRVRAGHRSAAGPDCAHTLSAHENTSRIWSVLTLEKLRKGMKTFILTAESTGCALGLPAEHAERRTETTWRKADLGTDPAAHIAGETLRSAAGQQVTVTPIDGSRCCLTQNRLN